MKKLLLLICFSTLVSPVFAELTHSDLDKIRLIINESEKRIKSEIKSDIAASEKQIKEYVDIKINGMDKRLSARIDLLSSFIFALIALIVVTVGIPQIIIAWRSLKDNSLQKQIDELSAIIKEQS